MSTWQFSPLRENFWSPGMTEQPAGVGLLKAVGKQGCDLNLAQGKVLGFTCSSFQSRISLMSSAEMWQSWQSSPGKRLVNMPRKQSTHAMASWIVWEKPMAWHLVDIMDYLHNKEVWILFYAEHSGLSWCRPTKWHVQEECDSPPSVRSTMWHEWTLSGMVLYNLQWAEKAESTGRTNLLLIT